MANEDPSTSDEACQMALSAALNRGMEVCGDEEVQKRQAGKLFGIEMDEPDADCQAALEEGFDGATCASTRGTRQLVLCMVWHENEFTQDPLMEVHDGDFSDAVNEAWAIADEQCADELGTPGA